MIDPSILFPKPLTRPIPAAKVIPDLQGIRFLTWRGKGKRDKIRGGVAPTIHSNGIDLERRKTYQDIEGLKVLASFPSSFQFVGTQTEQLKRIGNSVPPGFMEAIAKRIKEVLFPNMEPTVISTFAGCGGSSLGYKLAGFRELLAVEWDDNAVETFKLNFPDVPVYHGDIAKLTVDECLRLARVAPGELDILDGSPPCQGFSTAGKRQMDDSRNQLFREYVRLLRGLKPKVFVMENVSGMVKGKMKLIFAEIMRELKGSGYQVKCQLMNAMYFNVPQSRERVIFIGVREDLNIEPTFPRAQGRPIVLRKALEGIDYRGIELTGNLAEIGKHAIPGEDFATTQIRLGAKKRKNFSTKKLNWDKPSNTLTKTVGAGLSGLVLPNENRFLSIAACKRIASFPDEYQFIGKYEQQWARIGNSVPPRFMQAIAEHIKDYVLSV